MGQRSKCALDCRPTVLFAGLQSRIAFLSAYTERMSEADPVVAYEIALKALAEAQAGDDRRAALREAWFAYDNLPEVQRRRLPRPDGTFASRPHVPLEF